MCVCVREGGRLHVCVCVYERGWGVACGCERGL